MYFDINFSTDVSTEMADALKESRLSSVLLRDIANKDTVGQVKMNFNLWSSDPDNIPFLPDSEASTPSTPYEDTSLTCWDMNDWFQDVVKKPLGAYAPIESLPAVFLGKYSDEINMAQADRSYDFFKNLMVLIFGGKFQKMVDEKTRTFQEIMKGKKAYNETVLYKIEKWEANPLGGTAGKDPIQVTFLPNSSQIDVHRFIDTQVKYNKSYVYRIYAYEMIFGTQYSYTLDALPTNSTDTQKADEIALGQARICIFTRPSLKLVEVPYYDKTAKIIDAPPIWPDVDIIPLRGVKDKLKFFFRGNVGEYKLKPILIEPSDQQEIDSIKERQKDIPGLPAGIVQYRSDDQASIFEVFRTDEMPTSYLDFANHKHAHVVTDQFDTPCKTATGGAFMDHLTPNKKYYYTFRTIDNHGHFSNPSPVYEVEIVYDAGAPFLLTRVITEGHDFKKERDPPQMISKNVKKYIQIKPAATQSVVNYAASFATINGETKPLIDGDGLPTVNSLKDIDTENNTIQLGADNETLWGKKLKIRLTSKKTGRKIDLNINFNHKHQEIIKNDNTNILCEKE
jgi:hypothetical protein